MTYWPSQIFGQKGKQTFYFFRPNVLFQTLKDPGVSWIYPFMDNLLWYLL